MKIAENLLKRIRGLETKKRIVTRVKRSKIPNNDGPRLPMPVEQSKRSETAQSTENDKKSVRKSGNTGPSD